MELQEVIDIKETPIPSTHMIVIVDESGSMDTMHAETMSGINRLIADQQTGPGVCTLTLIFFSYEMRIHYLGENITSLDDINNDDYRPHGGTALLDAIALTLVSEQARLSQLHDAEKPGLITVTILTDGEENSSRHWNLEKTKKIIAEREAEGWHFTFLGKGLEVAEQGNTMSIKTSASYINTENAFAANASQITRARKAYANSNSNQIGTVWNFTPQESQVLCSN